MQEYKFKAWVQGLQKDIFSSDENYAITFCGDSIWVTDSYGDHYDVKPYDVAQLVGYHKKHGLAVYEGDVIHFKHNGEPLSAQFTPCLADKYRKEYFSGDLIRWSK